MIRDGAWAMSPTATRCGVAQDLVITNALGPRCAVQGIIKADIGVKHGRTSSGPRPRAWQSEGIQQGITPGMVIGAATAEVIAGRRSCIVTAGGVDSHIHFICPQQIDARPGKQRLPTP